MTETQQPSLLGFLNSNNDSKTSQCSTPAPLSLMAKPSPHRLGRLESSPAMKPPGWAGSLAVSACLSIRCFGLAIFNLSWHSYGTFLGPLKGLHAVCRHMIGALEGRFHQTEEDLMIVVNHHVAIWCKCKSKPLRSHQCQKMKGVVPSCWNGFHDYIRNASRSFSAYKFSSSHWFHRF